MKSKTSKPPRSTEKKKGNERGNLRSGPLPRVTLPQVALSPADQQLFSASLAAHQQGQIDVARVGYLQLLSTQPNHADSMHLLGVIALNAGDLAQANRLIYAALQRNPNSAIYCNNYGEVLRNQKQFAQARGYLEMALRLSPGYSDALNNFGSLALDEGDLESAIYFYRESLKQFKDSARTWYNLGTVLHKTKRYEEAEQALRQSLQLAANSANTWNNLGLVMLDGGRVDEAIDAYRQALTLDPHHQDAPANLGAVLMTHRMEYAQALELLLAGRKARPESALIELTIASLYGTIGEVELCQSLVSTLPLQKLDAGALSNALFMSNYATGLPQGELLRRYQVWGEAHAKPKDLPYRQLDGQRPPINWAAGGRRMRIGYLSPDFKNHSVQYFLAPVIANHDATKFEVFAYSNVMKEDSITQRFKTLVPHWRDVSGLADKEVAALIRDDGIDVLIDTSGHTADHRLSVFGYRPAPIQVTWLGYGSTTGIAAMDYFIGDERFTPPECDAQFCEAVYRLNRPFLVYRPPQAPDLSASPFKRKGYITIGSLTRLIRLNDDTIKAWVAIAKQLGNARIYLDQPILEKEMVANTVRQRFMRHGLPANQLELGWRKPYWSAYQDELDIALDPFPHNAGTTTIEALWMGVPVVSLVGNTSLGRFGATLLTAVGHSEWLANDVNDYITKALNLATDRPTLEQLRRQLRAAVRSSALMDERGLAAALEEAFIDMCSKAPANTAQEQKSFVVPSATPREHMDGPAPVQEDRSDQSMKLSGDAYSNQVEAMLIGGKWTQALALSQAYIAANPSDYRGYLAQGLALRQMDQLAPAIESYRQARTLAPDVLPILMNLGRALSLGGNFVEAVQVLSKALEQAPENAACQSQLSHALFHLERFQESESVARKAIELDPKHLDAWQNLGNALRLQDKNREAQLAFEQILKINPRHLDAYTCIGSIVKDNADVAGALAVYKSGLEYTTDKAHNLWNNYFFVLNYEPDLQAIDIAKRYMEWGDAVQGEIGSFANFPPNKKDLERPLRIGLVSGDFCSHVVRHFLFPWLDKIDRNRFELFFYTNSKKNDIYTERFKVLATEWREVTWLSDDKAHQVILEDGVDILVDLSGHTAGNRLGVFARRAAPCQVAWIGTGYTTGLSNVDYFLADDHFVPEGAENLFAEKIVRFAFAPFAYLPEFPSERVSALPAQENGYVTFGCLSRAVRLNHKVIAAWAQILLRLPTARLRLDHPHMITPELRGHLQQQFAALGVDDSQLVMLATRPHWDAFDAIDIALDPFPHNAGTSTIEAMWKGVPVLSLADRPSVGRFGVMFLHAVDLDDWVATDENEYVELAVRHAGDIVKLAQLRSELRRRLEASVLLDGEVLSVHLSRAFEMMWDTHCQGARADHFRVPALPMPLERVRSRSREATIALKDGRCAFAAHLFKQILLFNPSDRGAWLNLGACYTFQKDSVQAIACYRRSVEVDPDYVAGWYNLGVTLQDCRRHSEAEVAYQQVLRLDPLHDQALNNLGVICHAATRGPEALSLFNRALAIQPDRPSYLNNLGNLLEQGDQLFKAIRVLTRAVEIAPDNLLGFTNLAIAYRKMAMFDEAMAAHSHFGATIGVNHPLLFTVNYHPDLSAEQIYEVYQRECAALNQLQRRTHPALAPKTKLTVGLVGGDFRGHAAIKFLMPLIKWHDPARIALVVLANQVKEDEVTKLVQTYARWVNVYEMDDAAFCDTVERLGIDILIDVAGWTNGNRLEAMARKPAPVQISWLGYGYTTGLEAVDWFVGDPLFTPPGCEPLFSEQICRLPHVAFSFHGTEGLPQVAPLPATASGQVTFGYLGRPIRLNYRVLAAWASILKAIPTARLILDNQPFDDVEVRDHFLRKFADLGVHQEQLLMRHSRPHWGSFADIDIALDPFPHNAGTTTIESLLMGVPVLTLRDRPSVGRFGDMILHAVGLDDWVADSEAEYIGLACDWAQRLAELAAMRSGLRVRLMASPLGDGAAFASDFTNALFDIWGSAASTPTPRVPADAAMHELASLFNQGRYPEAEPLARAMTVNFPEHGFGWRALCLCLKRQGFIEPAIALMRQTVALRPGDVDALYILGNTLREQSQFTQAEEVLRQVLVLKPDYEQAHYNLGNTLKQQGQLVAAEASLRQALRLKPDFAEALNNLSNILKEQGRLVEAQNCLRQAIKIKPDYAEAHNGLGALLLDLGQYIEAEASLQRALQIIPDMVPALINLGSTLRALHRLVEARDCCRRALSIASAYGPQGYQSLANLLATLSDFSEVVALSDKALQLAPANAQVWEQRLYAFSYHPDLAVDEIYAEFVRWGNRFPNPMPDFSAHQRVPGKRLRVGYVSPDFRRHTSRFYFLPLMANHDPAVVELYAYANVRIEDDATTQFKGLIAHWRNVRGVADADMARMISQDRIDILVDCCNHMQDDRLGVFALRPAPIQVTWLGAAWTTGLEMVDYALFDSYIAPAATLTREAVVRLPHAFVAYRPPETMVAVAAAPCLVNGHITFGYTGRTERLNHHCFRVWGEILRQNPEARFILDFGPFADPPTQAHYRQLMSLHGMDSSRVSMRCSANIFAGLSEIDMLLDSFPHSGGTMLFDALWMGVPVLTLASRPPVGRIGTSLMMNLALPQWVANSEDEYLAKAGMFARDQQFLGKLRSTMRERMQNSPLMDEIGFARAVEAAYQEMWQRFCNNEKVVPIEIKGLR